MLLPEQRCILIAARCEDGALHIRVCPDWRNVALEPDPDYWSALFDDFVERAKAEPEALFEQLCSLSVGPLVTQSTGDNIAQDPEIVALWQSFVDLARG